MKYSRKRRKNSKFSIPTKYLFLGICFTCFAAIFLSLTFSINGGPFKNAASAVFSPMQKGMTGIANYLNNQSDHFETLSEVQDENIALQSKIDELIGENSTLKLETYELDNLRELYALDQKYPSYDKIGARVIGKSSDNWFSTFFIDKGSEDGIEVDMNVISDQGLVGLVTNVAKHSATVRSVVDDNSHLSGMILSTSDTCIIDGTLKSMTEDGTVIFSKLKDNNDMAAVGDEVVTSHISSKYLQGILVGHISQISTDANNLSKSGKITPVVDFEHLEEVLVILQKKDDGE